MSESIPPPVFLILISTVLPITGAMIRRQAGAAEGRIQHEEKNL